MLVLGCSPLPRVTEGPLSVPVASSDSLDVAPLNARIADAEADGLGWPMSPLDVTMTLLAHELDASRMEVSFEANRGEVPDTVVVVVARDGFKDDSVRGDWHRAVLFRTGEGTWRLNELRRAFRCYRGRSTDSYSGGLCL
jgi:hypothetical protein